MKYALVPSIVGRPDRYFSFTRVVFFWPRYRASFPGVIKDPPANCFMSFSICFAVMVSPSVLKLRFCGVFFSLMWLRVFLLSDVVIVFSVDPEIDTDVVPVHEISFPYMFIVVFRDLPISLTDPLRECGILPGTP